jgi:cobalt-zinc-cadmium efflux system outer membrane protein
MIAVLKGSMTAMKNLYFTTILYFSISIIVVPYASAQGPSEERDPTFSMSTQPIKLSKFIQDAWLSNPRIEESQARVEAAHARQKAASKWLRNPEIEFEQEEVEGEERSKIFGISQEIDLSGKSIAKGKVAKFEYQSEVATHDLTVQKVTLSILKALIGNKSQREVAKLFQRRAELMTRFSDLAEKKNRAGDIGGSELNLARLALSETLILQAEALSALSQSEQDLKAAIGFHFQHMSDLPDLPDEFPAARLDEAAIDKTIMHLPSIRVLRNELDASRAAITSARLKKLPDPTVSVRSGKDGGRDIVGLSVSMPLNIFNPFRAEVKAAKYDAMAQDRAFYGALYAAKPTLIASKRRYEVTLEAWKAWQETGANALTDQIVALDLKYSVGDLSATDYLVQVEQALDVEITALELQLKTWQAWFEWLAASGSAVEWIRELGEM